MNTPKTDRLWTALMYACKNAGIDHTQAKEAFELLPDFRALETHLAEAMRAFSLVANELVSAQLSAARTLEVETGLRVQLAVDSQAHLDGWVEARADIERLRTAVLKALTILSTSKARGGIAHDAHEVLQGALQPAGTRGGLKDLERRMAEAAVTEVSRQQRLRREAAQTPTEYIIGAGIAYEVVPR